ncbi:MAG: hypothetical protein GY945_08885 [Rhodobacteraceae bacterium]|nr:hypothetical protein [Paracoccaceae bacterium]
MTAWMQVSRTPRSIFELGMALPGVGEALKQEIAGVIFGKSAGSMGI